MAEKKKHILTVEDDLAIVEIYKIILEKAHFAVDAISSGREVLKALEDMQKGERQKPDVILLDLILPDLDGMEVLKKIKAHDATRGIKVFIMTNKESTVLEMASDLKPDEFLIKANTTPTDIVALLKKHLGE